MKSTGDDILRFSMQSTIPVKVQLTDDPDVMRIVPESGLSIWPSGQDITTYPVTFTAVTGEPIKAIEVRIVRDRVASRHEDPQTSSASGRPPAPDVGGPGDR